MHYIDFGLFKYQLKSWKKSENLSHQNFVEGLSNIISALDMIFLDTSSQTSENNDFYIKVYDAIYLKNGKILKITGKL